MAGEPRPPPAGADERTTAELPVAGGPCPPEETLILIAAGVDDDSTRSAAAHARSCAACQSQLRSFRRDARFVSDLKGVLPDPRTPAAAAARPAGAPAAEPFILPGYAVEGEIHRGGQGIVYRAIQLDTKRPVAVKMLLRGSFATARELRRFEREVEIAASLRHPHIVTIYDTIAIDDGRSALAMELVEGVTIDAWAQGRVRGGPLREPRTLAQRVAMIAAIARAVQYAHSRAIIHRDLKPGNVLVDAEDQPHVLDFGLARRTAPEPDPRAGQGEPLSREASVLVSMAGVFNGTPAYASPEQLSGDPAQVATRSDVYSLGIMLYELATGRLPTSFTEQPGAAEDRGGIDSIISKKTSGRFPRPSEAAELTRSPRVNADLDAVILRAIAADKNDRYQTALQLAADLDAFLLGEAVTARSADRWYRARKTIRKNRRWLSVVGAAAVLVLGFSVYLAVLASRLDDNAKELTAQSNELVAQRDSLRAELLRSEVRLARAETRLGNVPRAESVLGPLLASQPDLDLTLDSTAFAAAPDVLRTYWALWEMMAASHCRAAARTSEWTGLFPGADDDSVRTVSDDGRVADLSIPDLTSRTVWRFEGFELSRSTRVMAMGADRVLLGTPESISCWRIGAARPVAVWPRSAVVKCSLFSGANAVVYMDVDRRVIRQSLDPAGPAPVVLLESGPDPEHAIFSSSGRFLASAETHEGRRSIAVWSLADGAFRRFALPAEVSAIAGNFPVLNSMEVDPSEGVIAFLWGSGMFAADMRSGETFCFPSVFHSSQSPLRFNRSGRLLAVCEVLAGRTLVWARADPGGPLSFSQVRTIESTTTQPVLLGSDTSAGPARLVTAGAGVIRVWDLSPPAWGNELASAASWPPTADGAEAGRPTDPALEHSRTLHCVRFSPNGAMIAAGSSEGDITIWRGNAHTSFQASDPRTPGVAGRVISDLAFSPDGSRLVSTGYDGTVRLWDARTWAPVATLPPGANRKHCVSFTADGSAVVFGEGAETKYNDPRAGRGVATRGDVLRWSFGSPGGPTLLWSHANRVGRIARQPGGPLIATLSPDATVMVGDPSTGAPPMVLRHPTHPRSMDFSPDGKTLATACDDHLIRLWDLTTGAVVKQWAGYDSACSDVCWHTAPGGSVLLFTLYRDGHWYIWDTRTGEQIAGFAAHRPDESLQLCLSPDGRTLLTAGLDCSLRAWDLAWYRPHMRSIVECWRGVEGPAPVPAAAPPR